MMTHERTYTLQGAQETPFKGSKSSIIMFKKLFSYHMLEYESKCVSFSTTIILVFFFFSLYLNKMFNKKGKRTKDIIF